MNVRSVLLLMLFGCLTAARPAEMPQDDVEMRQIFDADQKDRQAPVNKLDWNAIAPRDAGRKKRVRELLDLGRLKTGQDFERAALVFQHGSETEDILLAHVLAVTAIGKGNPHARWLSAATLDRFLQRVGRPQIFGTQFTFKTVNGKENWTMEPYTPSLIGPYLRGASCVPSTEDQQEQLKAFRKGVDLPEIKSKPCGE